MERSLALARKENVEGKGVDSEYIQRHALVARIEEY